MSHPLTCQHCKGHILECGNRTFITRFEHCDETWEQVWCCACNSECPVCGREIEPIDYEEVE
jgi:hypothetical protein